MSSSNKHPIAIEDTQDFVESVAEPELGDAGVYETAVQDHVIVEQVQVMSGPSLARLEQEQRSAQVRDINARIAGLEDRITGMTCALETSRDNLGNAFANLERQVRKTDGLLLQQQQQVDALQKTQRELYVLQEQLDKARRKQGVAIEALTLDTRRRFADTRASLVALHDVCEQQKEALFLQRRDHDAVSRHVSRLQGRIEGLDSEATEHRADTRRRFRWTQGALAGVAVLVIAALGLIAWYQVYPTAVPESVKAQFAAVAAGLGEQEATDTAILADLQRQGSQIAALGAADQALSDALANEAAALRASDARLADGVAGLRHEQAQLQGEMSGIREEWRNAYYADPADEIPGGQALSP